MSPRHRSRRFLPRCLVITAFVPEREAQSNGVQRKILSIYEHHEFSPGVARDGDGAARLGYARFEAPRTRLEMAIVQVNKLTGAGARCSYDLEFR